MSAHIDISQKSFGIAVPLIWAVQRPCENSNRKRADRGCSTSGVRVRLGRRRTGAPPPREIRESSVQRGLAVGGRPAVGHRAGGEPQRCGVHHPTPGGFETRLYGDVGLVGMPVRTNSAVRSFHLDVDSGLTIAVLPRDPGCVASRLRATWLTLTPYRCTRPAGWACVAALIMLL